MLQNSDANSVKTIYIIRHGQTDFNKQGIIQGSGVDSDLNDTGRTQALQFYNHYRDVPFQKIYTSSLKRTHQTVAFFTASEIPCTILPELDEINWGKMEGALPTEANTAEFIQMIETWRTGILDVSVEGGETPLALFERQKSGLARIESDSFSPVLVCMHGRAMRSFLCLLTGHPLHLMDDFEHGNVCLYILEKTTGEDFYHVKLRNSRLHLHESV